MQYHIYSNHGTGGPVDLSTPLVTTSDLSCVIGPLNSSTDSTFLVRAFAVDTGLEEANTVACVRVAIGVDGSETSGLPNSPHALFLSSVPGGGCLVGWAFAPAMGSGMPVGFHVYLSNTAIDYGLPLATIPYVAGRLGYSCLIPGPLSPATYRASVRSYNGTGTEQNIAVQAGTIGRSLVPYIMDQAQTVVIGN